MSLDLQRRRRAIHREIRDSFEAEMDAVANEVRAATKPLDDQWKADLAAANAKHASECRKIHDRHRIETQPIRDSFTPRFAAITAKRDEAIQKLQREHNEPGDSP